MKKIVLIIGIISITTLVSCGPSSCDCYNHYSQANESFYVKDRLDPDEIMDCIDKFGDDIPDSYRGKEKFAYEMERITGEKCN